MTLRQDKWSDMTALNTMPAGRVEVDAWQTTIGTDPSVTILVRNTSKHIAFFERATVSASKDGNEILPIQYDDNYITLFPGESIEIHATLRKDARAGWVRLEGYNTPTVSVMIHDR
jgi:exo-1,4-beta-D-glucosaminidase